MSNTTQLKRADFIQQYVDRETAKEEGLKRFKALTAEGHTVFTTSAERGKAGKPRSKCFNPLAPVCQALKAIGLRKPVAFDNLLTLNNIKLIAFLVFGLTFLSISLRALMRYDAAFLESWDARMAQNVTL